MSIYYVHGFRKKYLKNCIIFLVMEVLVKCCFFLQGPLSIVAGLIVGALWGAMTSVIPEKGDLYVVPLRFLILFLGGLFFLFISNMIGWSGAGKLFYETSIISEVLQGTKYCAVS